MTVGGFDTTDSRFGKNATPEVIAVGQGACSGPDCAATVEVKPVFQPAPISNPDLSNRRSYREKRPSLLSGLSYIYTSSTPSSL